MARAAPSVPTTTTPNTSHDPTRVICSTIRLRYRPLDQAFATIAGLGFAEIDFRALAEIGCTGGCSVELARRDVTEF
jgi:hypothetical protein